MDQDFVRLGAEMQAARKRLRPQVIQEAAGDAIGVGRSTIQKIERGEGDQTTATTVHAYARFLGWTDDSVERVLRGGKPVMRADTEHAPPVEVPSESDLDLTPGVAYELRAGKTVDSLVFNLGPDDEDGHLIVVVQTKKDATPEQIERVVARFRGARRYLQGMATEDDGVAGS